MHSFRIPFNCSDRFSSGALSSSKNGFIVSGSTKKPFSDGNSALFIDDWVPEIERKLLKIIKNFQKLSNIIYFYLFIHQKLLH